MKNKLRFIMIFILSCIFIVSVSMIVRQQIQYRENDADHAVAIQTAGLTQQRQTNALGLVQPETKEEIAAILAKINLSALREINEDVVGWIEIPNTIVSYPLLQGKNNQYYLNHTWQKESNSAGSIFLECTNNSDFSDFHTIIYGHRMNNEAMFGTLKYYKDLTYWQEHPSIYISTDSGVRRYDIFAAYKASTKSIVYQLNLVGQEKDFIQFCLDHSVIDTQFFPTAEDQILTLSTCTGNGHAARWVVQAYLAQVYAQSESPEMADETI